MPRTESKEVLNATSGPASRSRTELWERWNLRRVSKPRALSASAGATSAAVRGDAFIATTGM